MTGLVRASLMANVSVASVALRCVCMCEQLSKFLKFFRSRLKSHLENVEADFEDTRSDRSVPPIVLTISPQPRVPGFLTPSIGCAS